MLARKHLSEPWFSLVLQGKKTVEGRINDGFFKDIAVGDKFIFYNGDRSFEVRVIAKRFYKTFLHCLEIEGLEKILPTIDNYADGINVYRKYYSIDEEREFGVIAIEINVVNMLA